ncbi:hypothetical protein [Amycolatopsis circi]|uniref:hypothetical protein n=1 Tax=Amycolatopsis circi TaxID=871959 RepID=UPI0013BEA085|nr:hypothetical protein [Amycolatopsis circi]
MTRSIRLTTAILAGVSASVVLAGCGGGAQPGDGNSAGDLVDFGQYQLDAGFGSPPGPSFGLLWTFDPTTMQLSPGDCMAAQGDETRLETDTATWPAVLKQPMDSAEKNFRAAIADCSSGDFTAMTSDINQGKDSLVATQNAFGAHCKQTSDATKLAC